MKYKVIEEIDNTNDIKKSLFKHQSIKMDFLFFAMTTLTSKQLESR